MYAKGRAVPKDDQAAANWFRKAAEQGDPRAQYNLGVLFVNGRGVERDYAQAYVWLRQAALSDDPEIASQSAEGLAVVLEAMSALEKDTAQQLSAAYRHRSHPANQD
jgi:TPR repeat protein